MEELNDRLQDNQKFETVELDFYLDAERYIISFREVPFQKVKLPLDSVYYFGYEFNNKDNKVRDKFIEAIQRKHSIPYETKHEFINKALERLHEHISIYNFDIVIFPSFRSYLNETILDKLLFGIPDLELLPINNFKGACSFELEHRYIQRVSVAKNIILIDDVTLSKVPLTQYLYAIRGINHTAPIIIFTFSNPF